MYVKRPLGSSGLTLGDGFEFLGAYVFIALVISIVAALPPRDGAQPTYLQPAAGSSRASRFPAGTVALLAFAAVSYVLGHGIHLSANSIHDLAARTGAAGIEGLAYLWDERIGHYVAEVGRAGFAVGLAWAEAGSGRRGAAGGAASALGATAYGFISFGNAVEGQTVPWSLPFSILYLAAHARLARRARRLGPGSASPAPVRRFFARAAAVQVLFFAIWGLWHRGFPEFTQTGILP